jgi:uncharacterized protein (DUF427 family)
MSRTTGRRATTQMVHFFQIPGEQDGRPYNSGRDCTCGGTIVMRATWKGATLAESNDTVVVEGNHYFPVAAIRREYFQPSATHTVCPWKGTASYYDVVVGESVNKDAAWYYPEPFPAAASIAGRVAFWKGVQVKDG